MKYTTSVAEVVEIKKDADFDVYDIEVENVHNFFANSINIHNSAEPKTYVNWAHKIKLIQGRAVA